ncbi:efflux RND transporter permease subunit [Siccirubricoccus phaeus]|uniref:efflux RND transporter permease subunit n=1 Tax=Siccirubricoccus phaeus TaxID=2595053 RepID=UPI0011F2138E|nr:efflux RND transporter permease subunit [Siccirubricoccus phaeus]
MSISEPFIRRPIATALLAIGLALTGLAAYFHLPIAPLPRVDLPTIFITASLPGADPSTMASAVAAPLERRIGAIPGVTELTSSSSLGSTVLIVQFDLSRDVEGAARDVQAALNAAGSDLPPLPNPPFFRKANPADAPVLILALTSETATPGDIYDVADSLIAPRLAQVRGVATVNIQGAEQPAIRVTVNPAAAASANIGLEAIRQAITGANVTMPTGLIDGRDQAAAIAVNDRLNTPEEYAQLIIRRTADGAVTRLGAIARVALDVRDRRQGGSVDGRPAVQMTIFKQADANVLEVVEGIQAMMPELRRWLPGGVEIMTIRDRSETIRASVDEVQLTLLISIALVILVVAIFLKRISAVVAAGAAVPLSLLGTFAAMWLMGYSLDNLSLMALTISVGFVVDDAIVMIENMARLTERGMKPMQAALEGARQIGFTVVSITVSLIAVFIPLLFMGGVVGRMFREFSATLAIAVAISGVISLTLTPMLAAHLAREAPPPPGRFSRAVDRGMEKLTAGYLWSLGYVLRVRRLMLVFTVALVGVTAWLYTVVPKGFVPDQDTGLIMGSTRASPDTSFQAMLQLQEKVVEVLRRDPAIASIASSVGSSGFGGSSSTGRMFISLKPLAERGVSAQQVIDRLRRPLNAIPGVQAFLRSVQDVQIGGRAGNASFQFVLLAPNLEDLATWSEKLVDKLRTVEGIADVNSDQQRAGLVTRVVIDRDAASRLGISVSGVTAALNGAFSQRQVSILYRSRNQYRVVLEVDPREAQHPEQVDNIYLTAADGTMVPLSSLVKVERTHAPLSVTHQGLYPAATITFNLMEGVAIGQATALVERAAAEIGLPDGLRTEFAGNARAFQSFTTGMPLLILAAVLAIYIVLGVLYEHLLHPVTIISTLPTAGIGALLALLWTNTPFGVISLIGVILLMGIVKKNAIMLVDFALEHERSEGIGGVEAILAACRERFRPILMTTLAAIFGAVPLVLEHGAGSELRHPLGIAIIGGLLLSQLLTLYTTPVVYLALDRAPRRRHGLVAAPAE